MRGIGPCYRDKMGRSLAVRLGDMYRDDFRAASNASPRPSGGCSPATATTAPPRPPWMRTKSTKVRRLRPAAAALVGDTTAYLLTAAETGKKILFEGAQGSLLDIDHGTFPYVTSSNSSGVGVPGGSGVPGRYVTNVLGMIKAYSTRVGGGPFPTEQANDIGQHIRDRGNEYGTVTRRPRRCGWFDAVAARYTARLSGVESLRHAAGRAQRAAGAEDLRGLRARRAADHRLPQPRG